MSTEQVDQFTEFIQKHFLQNKENTFMPTKENILPYFTCATAASPCFFSFYKEPEIVQTADLNVDSLVEKKKIVGIMSSRPVTVAFRKSNSNVETIDVYYVDYLCVDSANRKKGIAPQIIQTHEYTQRHYETNPISVSLFKREGTLTGIVPLTIFSIYAFNMSKWVRPSELLPLVSLLECTKTNFHFIVDFLKEMEEKKKFTMTICPSLTNILDIILSKNIYVYFLLKEHTIKAVYFFKKTCAYMRKGAEFLSCIASINNCQKSELFIHGYKVALWRIKMAHPDFQYAVVEEISDNYWIVDALKKRTKPEFTNPAAYFFYNRAQHTIPSAKMLVLL